MKNITKKSIIILGAIVFSFTFANIAFASYGHYAYSTDPVGYELDSIYYQQPININPIYPPYYQQPVVVTPTVTTTTKPSTSVVNNYYYQTLPTTKTVNTTVASGTPTYIPATNNTYVPTNGNNLSASAYNPYAQGYQTTGNGITALSLRGSGSFMPSSIWQWILTIILILIIIIIARMFVRKPDPSDHDVHIHNAPAH